MDKAVFLDRDGTIIKDVGYLNSVDDIELLPGVSEALVWLQGLGFKLVIVTNQSGIAKGRLRSEKLAQINDVLIKKLEQGGITISGTYCCPHDNKDNCECRKPKPYMIEKAAEDLDIDLKQSYMIGDKLSDLEAGSKAGCISIMLSNEYDLLKATKWIESIGFSNVDEVFAGFKDRTVAVIGDVMLDMWVEGVSERISPEAAVPIIDITNITVSLGGAANAARIVSHFGGTPLLVGSVGCDRSSEQMIKLLHDAGISHDYIVKTLSQVTTVKKRIMSHGQYVLRLDTETKEHPKQEVVSELVRRTAQAVERADIVLLSDYNKGVLTLHVIQEAIDNALKTGKQIIVDPKGDFLKYKGCTNLTPNVHEASLASRLPLEQPSFNMAQVLFLELKNDAITITNGEDGITVFKEDGSATHFPAMDIAMQSVVGAGDVISAVMALGAASGLDWSTIAYYANGVAGLSVAREATELPKTEECLGEFSPLDRCISDGTFKSEV